MADSYRIEELGIEVSFAGYDPMDWRNHADPDLNEPEDDNDELDLPTPSYVKKIGGIDPKEEGWD